MTESKQLAENDVLAWLCQYDGSIHRKGVHHEGDTPLVAQPQAENDHIDRWSRMPLSAPTVVWVGYVLILLALGAVAAYDRSTVSALFAVFAAAGFSFQFWTYAAWRGLRRMSNSPEKSADAR